MHSSCTYTMWSFDTLPDRSAWFLRHCTLCILVSFLWSFPVDAIDCMSYSRYDHQCVYMARFHVYMSFDYITQLFNLAVIALRLHHKHRDSVSRRAWAVELGIMRYLRRASICDTWTVSCVLIDAEMAHLVICSLVHNTIACSSVRSIACSLVSF